MLPAISIVVYICFIILLFGLQKLLPFIILSALALILLIVFPQKQLKSGFVPISIFLLATFLANILFNPGKILVKIGPFAVTEEGIHIASLRTLRVFLLIAGAKLLTVSTGLKEMVHTMGRCLSPLEKIGVPVKEFFGTMALAIDALPHLRKRISVEYGRRISDLERRTIYERIRLVFGFLLPVFIESIKNPESVFKELDTNNKSTVVNADRGGKRKGMEDVNG